MTRDAVVDDDALRELERGADWYERQRIGLGDQLLEEVGAVLDGLAVGTQHASDVAVQRPGVSVRRAYVARFPQA